MKNTYSRDDIVTFVKNLDVRAQKFTDAQIDNVINRGYAELTAVSRRVFSNEDVVNLTEYYENGELDFSLEVEDDCTEIYDLYLTLEGDKADSAPIVEQGVGIYKNSEVLYRDNRNTGTIHIKLSDLGTDTVFDNIVVKYFYTPTATDDSVYMTSQTYLAWQDAMWAATNYFLKDVESESQKRASLGRTSQSMVLAPEDETGQDRAVFGWT